MKYLLVESFNCLCYLFVYFLLFGALNQLIIMCNYYKFYITMLYEEKKNLIGSSKMYHALRYALLMSKDKTKLKVQQLPIY